MQILDDSVRSAYLRKMFVDMAALKKLLKPYHGIRSSDMRDTAEKELYSNLTSHLRHLRYEIRRLDYRDALKARETAIKERIREEGDNYLNITFYANSDKSRISYIGFVDDNGLPVTEVRQKLRVITMATRCGEQEEEWYNTCAYSSKLYWKDNFLEYIKTNGKQKLFSKSKYFRVNNDFYSWEDYFLFEEQAYERSKWGLYNGELKDLRKSIAVLSNSADAGGRMPVRFYKKQFYLDSMPDEEFEMKTGDKGYYLRIRLVNARSFSAGLTSDNFFWSMFKKKNKRFFTQKECLCLSKEDCCELEFEPSKNHKILFDEILKSYQEYCRNKCFSNEGSIYYTKSLENKYNEGIYFEVIYGNADSEGKSIKAQVLQELFSAGDYYTPNELKTRLKALSEILTEEAKYGGNKKRKKSDNF